MTCTSSRRCGHAGLAFIMHGGGDVGSCRGIRLGRLSRDVERVPGSKDPCRRRRSATAARHPGSRARAGVGRDGETSAGFRGAGIDRCCWRGPLVKAPTPADQPRAGDARGRHDRPSTAHDQAVRKPESRGAAATRRVADGRPGPDGRRAGALPAGADRRPRAAAARCRPARQRRSRCGGPRFRSGARRRRGLGTALDERGAPRARVPPAAPGPTCGTRRRRAGRRCPARCPRERSSP